MPNHFPLWKNALVVMAVVISIIYALPNLFGSDLAVQVSKVGGEPLDDKIFSSVTRLLKKNEINYQSIQKKGNGLLVRLNDSKTQLSTQALIKEKLGRNFSVALNIAPDIPDLLLSFNAKPMFLGLDLRGGVHFLLEVDLKSVIDTAYERYDSQVTTLFRKARLHKTIHYKNNALEVLFKDEQTKQQGISLIKSEASYLVAEINDNQSPQDNPLLVRFIFEKSALKDLKRNALKQNITTLRNRVNELGVSEPIIQQQGADRIVVQLPGVQDTARAKEILGAVATLEFRLVDEKNDVDTTIRTGRTPIGSRVYKFRDGRPLLLKKRVIATGENIANASSGFSQDNRSAMVNLSLDAIGGRAMLSTTKKYLHHRMAVVYIENKVETIYRGGKFIKKRSKTQDIINAATIQGVFSNRFQITGLDSAREARNLALLLRAGSLSAPIEIIEERTIGPSLGQDNINKGFISVLIGFFLVLIFMGYRYKVFGLVANAALLLNLLMIMAVLSLLQATLTLPGIAGIVLTVGMAVDANVLIFERIREELRLGSQTQKAIQLGYEKAFATIADANITTLIAAVVLFSFGTGPIKGFAITLSIGILTSMFSAIIASRAVINLIYGNNDNTNSKMADTQTKSLSI